MKFQFSVIDAETQAELSRMIKAGRDLSKLLGPIADFVISRIRLTFRTSTDPYGESWKPLKHRKGKPLLDTRHLSRSIVKQLGKDFVDIGTNVKYARIHQFGGTIKAKNKPYLVFKLPSGKFVKIKSVYIPARPFFPLKKGLPDAWQNPITKITRQFIEKSRHA